MLEVTSFPQADLVFVVCVQEQVVSCWISGILLFIEHSPWCSAWLEELSHFTVPRVGRTLAGEALACWGELPLCFALKAQMQVLEPPVKLSAESEM